MVASCNLYAYAVLTGAGYQNLELELLEICAGPHIRRCAVASTGEGKLFRKVTGYQELNAEAAICRPRSAGCASRASGPHRTVSAAHRFFRRGERLSAED